MSLVFGRFVRRHPSLYALWRRLRRWLPRPSGTSARQLRRHARAALTVDRSHAGESQELLRILQACGIEAGFVVDIAAGDGVTQSSTLALFRHPEWRGLAVENNAAKFTRLEFAYRQFPGATTVRETVTPDNVGALLQRQDVPASFEVLNLDLDSYDLDIAAALLRAFRPGVITMEINEKVPPPVHFAVTYDPEHTWSGDHFYGCSIVAAAAVVRPAGYVLASLHYNNAFFVRTDLARDRFADLPVGAAYDAGYRNRPDRRELFPWNYDVEHLLALAPEQVVSDLEERFRGYAGRFVVRVGTE